MPPRIRSSASEESQLSRTLQGSTTPQLERPNVNERAIVKLKPGTKSAFSSSSFGNRSQQGLADPASISTWLFDRKVWTIALVEVGHDVEDAAEINKMINLYHSTTKLLWPPEWESLDALPRVDGALEHARKLLFDQYKEICEQDSQKLEALDSAHTAIFYERFSTLMGAVIGSFTYGAGVSGLPVYNAEARHDWETVLYQFLVVDGEAISLKILPQRTLRLPRNSSADSTDSQEFLSSQLKIARTYLRQCADAVSATVSFNLAVRNQALAALAQANSFVAQLESLRAVELSRLIEERTTVEPRTGECDAIFVTPVPLGDGPQALKAREYLKTFSLVQHPDSVPQKLREPDVTPSTVSSSHLSPTTVSSSVPKSLSPFQKELLYNPFAFLSHESKFFSTLKAPEGFVPFKPEELLLTGFLVEYTKWNDGDGDGDGEAKALNKERMFLVSAVKHLAMLGIRGFAVFGLLTSGQKGGILMAWQSESDDKIYIIERNICTFNLSSPIQAFQFASFLTRVQEHTETLKHLFNERKAKFFKEAEDGTLPRWTKLAQVEEAGPEGEVVTGNVEGLPAIVVPGMVKDI